MRNQVPLICWFFKSNKIIQYPFFFSSESKCIDESLQTMLINSVRSLQKRTLTGKVLLLIYLSFYGSVRGISWGVQHLSVLSDVTR